MSTHIFDNLLEPVFVINSEGIISYCNEAAALLCDATPRKVVRSKTRLDAIFNFSPTWTPLEKLSQVTDATGYEELFFTNSEGREGKAQLSIQPIENDYLIYFRDVTLEETLQKKYRAELEQKQGYIEKLEKAQARLEDYNRNLEKIVSERTSELKSLNLQMSALLDSLDQGFFIFNEEGIVLPVYSKACEKLLKVSPAGKDIGDVLQIPVDKAPGVKRWISTLFMDMLPFADLAELGPSHLINSDQRHVQFQYYPMLSAEGSLSGVVVVASDITDLLAAREEADIQRQNSKMILGLVENKKQAIAFLNEADVILQNLKSELSSTLNTTEMYRFLHTLKGGAGSFAIRSIVEQCHKMESLVSNNQNDSSFKSVLQKESETLESLFIQFETESSQFLGNRKQREQRRVEISDVQIKEFFETFPSLSLKLFNSFEQTFFLDDPAELLSGFAEMSKSLAESQGKSLREFIVTANGEKIDGVVWNSFLSNLVHVYRNAIDHGLETMSERSEVGKNPGGQIVTNFLFDQSSQSWKITIQDDGRGINSNKLREKLLEKGQRIENESDFEVIQHIFDAQVSTKDEVTEVSGRGVGLDAVKAYLVSQGGGIEVHSTPGKGCRFEIWLPNLQKNQKLKKQAA